MGRGGGRTGGGGGGGGRRAAPSHKTPARKPASKPKPKPKPVHKPPPHKKPMTHSSFKPSNTTTTTTATVSTPSVSVSSPSTTVTVSTSSSSSSEKEDLTGVGILFFLAGVFFLVLTIVIPIVVANDRMTLACGPAESLNFAEQMLCIPRLEDYSVTTESEHPELVKVYREQQSTLKQTTRTQTYKDYQADLSQYYDDFSISVPLSVVADLTVSCSGTSCDSLKFYWLSDSEFNNAITSANEFLEDKNSPTKEGFGGNDNVHVESVSTNTVYHIVFSNSKSSGIKLTYSITLTYTVYDVSKLTPASCDGECVFDDLKDSEVIIMDYPETSGKYEYFAATLLYLEGINLGGVLAAAIILGVVTLICFFLAAFYMKKIWKKPLKKVKKCFKKADKEAEKQAEKMEQNASESVPSDPSAPSATLEVTPDATPAGYPVDPSYDHQQPLTADPTIGQEAYPVQQAYPGQEEVPSSPQAYPGQEAIPIQEESPSAPQAYPGQEAVPIQESAPQAYPGQETAVPVQEDALPAPETYPGQDESYLTQV